MKQLLLVIIPFIIIPLAQAAIITGTIYDYSLNTVNGAVITINTTPSQVIVARNGTYSLHVPRGTYELIVGTTTPQGVTEKAQQTITITDQETYTLDFILFPELEEIEAPDLNDLTLEEPRRKTTTTIIIGALIIITILTYIALKKRTPREEEDELSTRILRYVKQHKRTTQKDIRKTFPESEATISLVLSELESKGRIRKIKKGRSNIIIYVR